MKTRCFLVLRWVLAFGVGIFLFGCGGKGGSGNPISPTPNLEARIVVSGDGHPLAGVEISKYGSPERLGVTGSDGSLKVSVPKGISLTTAAFGYAAKNFPIDGPEVAVTLDGCNDLELTEVFASSIGVAREGATIYYPTNLTVKGRYRSVTYPWPKKVLILFDFVPWSGSKDRESGGAVTSDRFEVTYENWTPCSSNVWDPILGHSCLKYENHTDYVHLGMFPPGGGHGLTDKLVKMSLNFERR